MCGIIGYCGHGEAQTALLRGLEKLEYRGYDSCGIAVIQVAPTVVKTAGRISALRQICEKSPVWGGVGIGHTRWATHGKPIDRNAHPFLSKSGNFAIVHNGIIENYALIKAQLIEDGFAFSSDTDSEIIAHLLDKFYDGDTLKALHRVASTLKGWFAIAVVSAHAPSEVFAVKHRSPLIVGYGQGFNMLASDCTALCDCKKGIYPLCDGQFAKINARSAEIYDQDLSLINVIARDFDGVISDSGKQGYEHFMLKEIYEQPQKINALLAYYQQFERSCSLFKGDFIKNVNKIDIIGCGSAYFAGLAGAYAIESLCRIPVCVKNAGEYRYCNPISDGKTLTIAISQSGETADTIAGAELALKKGSVLLSIVNTPHSTLAGISNYSLYQNAGVEIAVATTKGYTTQLTALYLFALSLANALGIHVCRSLSSSLLSAGNVASSALSLENNIKIIADEITASHSVFFMGRGADYCSALEGALKLKEISYIHAEAYSASELKHGSIALISDGVPVIALCMNKSLESKMIGSVKEVKSRGAVVFGVTNNQCSDFKQECDRTLILPDFPEIFAPLITAPVLQLLGYHVAKNLNRDVDKPRNLAKSVTVE